MKTLIEELAGLGHLPDAEALWNTPDDQLAELASRNLQFLSVHNKHLTEESGIEAYRKNLDGALVSRRAQASASLQKVTAQKRTLLEQERVDTKQQRVQNIGAHLGAIAQQDPRLMPFVVQVEKDVKDAANLDDQLNALTEACLNRRSVRWEDQSGPGRSTITVDENGGVVDKDAVDYAKNSKLLEGLNTQTVQPAEQAASAYFQKAERQIQSQEHQALAEVGSWKPWHSSNQLSQQAAQGVPGQQQGQPTQQQQGVPGQQRQGFPQRGQQQGVPGQPLHTSPGSGSQFVARVVCFAAAGFAVLTVGTLAVLSGRGDLSSGIEEGSAPDGAPVPEVEGSQGVVPGEDSQPVPGEGSQPVEGAEPGEGAEPIPEVSEAPASGIVKHEVFCNGKSVTVTETGTEMVRNDPNGYKATETENGVDVYVKVENGSIRVEHEGLDPDAVEQRSLGLNGVIAAINSAEVPGVQCSSTPQPEIETSSVQLGTSSVQYAHGNFAVMVPVDGGAQTSGAVTSTFR